MGKRGGGSTSGSGTSFASPFATGVNALFKQAYGDYKSAAVLQWIVDSATPSVLTRVPSTTKNKLLYTAGL
ncbi:S8 family serine peptidase [Sphaerisporangium sp. NBC_01403]|uniref:S8 family serine peptidase n=1 Tax=Sphaerisporangium sp. NBC_01403 TaxID=2903599 RepID=UPI0038682F93